METQHCLRGQEPNTRYIMGLEENKILLFFERSAAIKWILMTFYYSIDQCLAQPSSETLAPAVEGNKYRDSQLDSVQRVRDLGTLGHKWDGSLKSLSSGSGNPVEKKAERV